MKIHKITTPFDKKQAQTLKSGDEVEITGTLYVARDAVHQKFFELLDAGKSLPIELADQIMYYMGPSPAPPGFSIGSAGPTTSGRMDQYAPRLISLGLRGMIGKGSRSQAVIDACRTHAAVYFAAIGGAGALFAQKIHKAEIIAYPELGAEALQRLEVVDFPVIVINDTYGHDFYQHVFSP